MKVFAWMDTIVGVRKATAVGAVLFAVLLGYAFGNGQTTQDAIAGTRHALVKQCDMQVTRAVGKAVVHERKKRVIFLPF